MSRKSPSKVRRSQTRNIGRDRERRRNEHWGEPMDTRCVCGKVTAHSEKEAWALAAHYLVTRGGEPARRVYECNHPDALAGTFHWTRLA